MKNPALAIPGDENSVREAIEKAITNLFANQPDIFKLTDASKPSEWNLANHLASEIGKFFEGYSHDTDLIKPNAENKRPDISIHKRGVNDFNLLVVELKRNNVKGLSSDKEKIKQYWFEQPYAYQFGAAINLNSDHSSQVEVLVNPAHPENNNSNL